MDSGDSTAAPGSARADVVKVGGHPYAPDAVWRCSRDGVALACAIKNARPAIDAFARR